jgi:nucleoside-diphosphate-sugar epimerase
MEILFVGGAGYIGGFATDVLLKAGHKVTVFDNLLYEDRYLKDVKFIYGDIRDTQKVVDAAINADVVILAAALVGDPACSIDPQLTESINYAAIKDVCISLPKEKHVIFLSTCSVYGAQDSILNENSNTNPLSVYASTKLRAEKYVQERNGTIFRLGTVYGVGDMHSRIRLDLVLNVLTLKAYKDKKISVNGGDQWRPIISVKDVGFYLLEACERSIRGMFILSHCNTTIKTLGELVAVLIGDTAIEYTPLSFQDARNYRVDTSKVNSCFYHRPKFAPEQEISQLLSIFADNRIKDCESKIYNNGMFIKNLLKK